MKNKKYWISSQPENCDVCQAPITNEFYDAKTKMGPWGTLCKSCFTKFGVGLGVGQGQQYQKDADGEFEKIKG